MAGRLRIAVVGSRDWNDPKVVANYIAELRFYGVSIEIVSGGARGVDQMVEAACSIWEEPFRKFPANWAKYGKAAGFMRNSEIAEYADFCVAFWDGKSRGTVDTLQKFRQKGKPAVTFIEGSQGGWFAFCLHKGDRL